MRDQKSAIQTALSKIFSIRSPLRMRRGIRVLDSVQSRRLRRLRVGSQKLGCKRKKELCHNLSQLQRLKRSCYRQEESDSKFGRLSEPYSRPRDRLRTSP